MVIWQTKYKMPIKHKKYSYKERSVFSTVSDGERAKKYPSKTI